MPILQREKTVEDRLRPTIEAATMERDKYKKQGASLGLRSGFAVSTTTVLMTRF